MHHTRTTAVLLTLLATGCASHHATEDRDGVNALLDAFHHAAATADEDGYFGMFTTEGVFIGTDATERWTVPEFRAWAKDAFQKESAWTFTTTERHLAFGADGSVAWFDERLDNRSFGECRGSGVVVREPDGWRVAHYVLSLPIPNDIAYDVVAQVRQHFEKSKSSSDDK